MEWAWFTARQPPPVTVQLSRVTCQPQGQAFTAAPAP